MSGNNLAAAVALTTTVIAIAITTVLAAAPANQALFIPTPNSASTLANTFPDTTISFTSTPPTLELKTTPDSSSPRIYWDIPIAKIPPKTTSLIIDAACSPVSSIRAISLHLNSGNGWLSTELPPPTCTNFTQLNAIPLLLTPEGTPADWHKGRLLRLSLWLHTGHTAPITLALRAINARQDSIAIIRSSSLSAPGQEQLATQMANRAATLLRKAAIPFTFFDDTIPPASMEMQLLILPYAPQLNPPQNKSLQRFVSKGGKLIVFYNGTAPLANSLGFKCGTWQGSATSRQWPDFTTISTPPLIIPHRTANLIPPYPTTLYNATTIAYWRDHTDRPTTIPACVTSDRGAWFAHVPPLATPSAVTFTHQLLARLLPNTIPHAPNPFTTPPPLITAPANEIRALWDSRHDARPEQLEALFSSLAQNGINTLFRHMQSGPTLHVTTTANPLKPRLQEITKAAANHHIALHAWVTCWSLDDLPPTQLTTFAAENRLMRDVNGNDLPWLSPSHPANRELILQGIITLIQNGVSGIHLDYLRYPENGCYAPSTRHAFEQWQNRHTANWPQDVLPSGTLYQQFLKFRQHEITSFTRAVTTQIRQIAATTTISAAVFPNPATALNLGQDWPLWLQENLIDLICPMTYTENIATFNSWLYSCQQISPLAHTRLIAGIGTSADESQLTATDTAHQINAVRSRHWRGFALFSRDHELLYTILPTLHPISL
ncbi:MAG: family 10 glycosylhydrolase [Lentisphaerae bacterium]|nr:family 10 glycosylhydrolase [Lentisphaerota bacterium]